MEESSTKLLQKDYEKITSKEKITKRKTTKKKKKQNRTSVHPLNFRKQKKKKKERTKTMQKDGEKKEFNCGILSLLSAKFL